MEKIEIKQNNKGFNLTFTIYQYPIADAVVKPLSGYTITLKVWEFEATTLKFSGDCSIVGDGSGGQCTYAVVAGNFDTVGMYYAEIELTKTGVIEDTEDFMIEVIDTAPAA